MNISFTLHEALSNYKMSSRLIDNQRKLPAYPRRHTFVFVLKNTYTNLGDTFVYLTFSNQHTYNSNSFCSKIIAKYHLFTHFFVESYHSKI